MIKVDRSPKPAILAQHEAQWLDKYRQAIIQNQLHPSPTNKEALKKAIHHEIGDLWNCDRSDFNGKSFLGKC